ncbi:MAG: DUF1643 domain-containing protein [Phycisphaeraceae bacterium]|nr:MAG: DUF1643 domain-containing protein [Phycisphaeraceae bacterium]
MPDWIRGDAQFSPCRRYRYTLTRVLRERDTSMMTIIGLNPSTATETTDDPTVRRCIRFAIREGFGRFVMLNAFGYRATDPADMKAQRDPVGPGNDEAIRRVVGDADLTVFAWGTHGAHLGRHDRVLELVGPRHCLGVTKAGLPRHPLYLRRDVAIVPYERALARS